MEEWRGPVVIASFNLPSLFFQQAIQIMCGVMVLSLGIILASAPHTAHFTAVISVLLNSAYPFVGAACVSRVLGAQEQSMQAARLPLLGSGLLKALRVIDWKYLRSCSMSGVRRT